MSEKTNSRGKKQRIKQKIEKLEEEKVKGIAPKKPAGNAKPAPG